MLGIIFGLGIIFELGIKLGHGLKIGILIGLPALPTKLGIDIVPNIGLGLGLEL